MTEKQKFGADEAILSLRAVVFEKGADYMYCNPAWTQEDITSGITRCLNFHGDEPGCIVGHLLAKLGLTPELARFLQIADGKSAYDSCGLLSGDPDFPWTFTVNAVQILGTAQLHQDDRKTWGFALERAEECYAEITVSTSK